MFKKILVAYDGSNGAERALEIGIQLGKCCGSDLHAISVEEDLPHYVATIGEFEEVKRKKDEFFAHLNTSAVEKAAADGVKLTPHIAAGHEVETIVNFCKDEGFDLLVIGFVGHHRIFDFWGGTSRTITRLAPCSVVVAK